MRINIVLTILEVAFPKTALLLLTVVVFFGFSTAISAETEPKFQTSEEVVSELIEAMKINDAERIRAVFAENASQAYGQGKPKSGKVFRSWLESDIIRVHGRVENPTFDTEEDKVILKGKYLNNTGYSSTANFLFTVKNGKIIDWRMRY
ncbi:MAG: nuclear transport factor 2 family protein [Opitutales bacterium]